MAISTTPSRTMKVRRRASYSSTGSKASSSTSAARAASPGELDAHDCCGVDGLTFIRRQLVELACDRANKARRDGRFERVEQRLDPPPVATLADEALAHEVVDHVSRNSGLPFVSRCNRSED